MARPKEYPVAAVVRHLHTDYDYSATRREAFLNAPEPVRREVLAVLTSWVTPRPPMLPFAVALIAVGAIIAAPVLQHPILPLWPWFVTVGGIAGLGLVIFGLQRIDDFHWFRSRRAAFWIDIYTRDLPAAPPPKRRGLFRRP